MESSKPKLSDSASNRKSVSNESTKKTRSIDDLFEQNQALFEITTKQNKIIIDRVCSMDRQVKLLENTLVTLQSSTNSIDEKLEKIKAEMDGKIETHDTEISQLRHDVTTLSETVHKIISENDNVYFELNKLNLIISGLPDSVSETPDQLAQTVKPLLNRFTSKPINIDCAFRLGKFSTKYPRRVKIRLSSLSERNMIWSHREKAPPLLYINEDLSPNVRQKQAQLRQQKREILEKKPFV
jgi:septation ring formation regulator EzrA